MTDIKKHEPEINQAKEINSEKELQEQILESLANLVDFNDKNKATMMYCVMGDGKTVVTTFAGSPQSVIIALKTSFKSNQQLFTVVKQAVMEFSIDMEIREFQKSMSDKMKELQKLKEEKSKSIGGEPKAEEVEEVKEILENDSITEKEEPDSKDNSISDNK